MDTKTRTILIVGIILLIFVGVGGVFAGMSMGREQAYREKDAEFAKVLDEIATDHKQVVVTKNEQVASLQEALSTSEAEVGTLADLVRKLRERPAKVQYITKVETKLVPSDPEVITVPVAKLPEEHLFALELPDGQLVVARVGQVDTDGDGENDSVEFETYQQEFALTAALGEQSSSFLLQGKTAYDDEFREIPVDVNVTRITPDPPKLLGPRLALGITAFGGASNGIAEPVIGAGASLTLPWLHPRPDLDVITPRVTFGAAHNLVEGQSKFTFRGGLDVVSYNLGRENGFIQDLWLGIGPSYGTDGSWSVDLTVSTRL